MSRSGPNPAIPDWRRLKRIPGLDGLRAISIAGVVTSHVGHERGAFHYGSFGVEIFFVLSGFLITHLLCSEEERHGQISLRGFYRHRAFRILPAAFAYLIAVSLWTSWRDLLHCAFFVRNLTSSGSDLTSHFWSLSIEEQFYLCWPLAFLLLRSNRRRLKVALFLFAAAPFWRLAAIHLQGTQILGTFRTDLMYDRLLGGCCLALLLHCSDRMGAQSFMQSKAALVLAIASLAWTVPHQQQLLSPTCRIAAVAVVINYVIRRPGGWLNWAPVVWLGRLSYSLYLWQQPFCWRASAPIISAFPFNLAASLMMSSASLYLVETPFLRLRDGISRRRVARVAATAN